MTTIHKAKAILYYDKEYTDEFIGRKLSQQEYDDISLEDLQTAILHSVAGDLWDQQDFRSTREFYDLSVDELKQVLKEQQVIIVRNLEPTFREEFPHEEEFYHFTTKYKSEQFRTVSGSLVKNRRLFEEELSGTLH
jgi:hypothetical protein